MSLLDQLKRGLTRTREVLNTPVEDLVRGRRPLDPHDLESIEEALLAADMGVAAVGEAMETLRARSGQIAAGSAEAMRQALIAEMQRALERPVPAVAEEARPRVVSLLGVNGAGKTTTIGKLAHGARGAGGSVLVVAADTFRAAAAEQLQALADQQGRLYPQRITQDRTRERSNQDAQVQRLECKQR